MNLNCKNQNEIGLTNKDSKTEFYGINKKIEDILNTEEIIIKICEELLKSKNLITEKTENEIIKQISNKLNRNLNDAEKELVKNIISEKKEEIDKKHIKTRKNWGQNNRNHRIHKNKLKTENTTPKFLFEEVKNFLENEKKFSDYVFFYKKICELEDNETEKFKEEIKIFMKNFSDYINKNQENLKILQIINFFDFIKSKDYKFIEDFDFLINLLTNDLNEEIDLKKLNLFSLDIIDYSPRSINKKFIKYLTKIIKIPQNDLNSINFSLLVKKLINLDEIILEKDFFEAINILINSIEDKFLKQKLIIDLINNLKNEEKYLPENFLENLYSELKKFELNTISINDLRKLLLSNIEYNKEYFDKIFGIIYLRKDEIGFKEAKAINSFFHKIPEYFLSKEYKDLFEEILINNKDKINYEELQDILIFSNYIFTNEIKDKIRSFYKKK